LWHTLREPPEELGVTHWSSRLLAPRVGLHFAQVAAVWRRWGIQPWREETFKFSTDPQLEAKVRDVVGLYLAPPDNAIVLCVDEKSQVQALDRTQPMLPVRPGLPARRTHDYVRHGTTTLFAALEVATGKVVDACYERHRHQEFLRFLRQVAKAYPRQRLHIVCDNYATHKHEKVERWLARNKRITLHFTPTSASWPNLVGGVLFDHHPPGHPPRHLRVRPRPRRRHPHLHRRLQRTLRTIRVDQNRRRNPRPLQTTKDINYGTLVRLRLPPHKQNRRSAGRRRCRLFASVDQHERRSDRLDGKRLILKVP
jgi:transposase